MSQVTFSDKEGYNNVLGFQVASSTCSRAEQKTEIGVAAQIFVDDLTEPPAGGSIPMVRWNRAI